MIKTLFILFLASSLQIAYTQSMPEKYVKIYDDLNEIDSVKRIVKIDQLIKKNPNDPWYYWMKSVFYEEMGKGEMAYEGYEKALAIDSNFSRALGSYAQYLCQNDSTKLDVALKHIQKAISIEPEEVYYYITRATIYFKLKQYDQAMIDAKKVVAFDIFYYTTSGIELIINILQAENKNEELKQYIDDFDLSSFLVGPVDGDFKVKLGNLFLKFAEKSKACECFKSAQKDFSMFYEDRPKLLKVNEKLKKCN